MLEALEEARRLGFLGNGPMPDQVDHAAGFAAAARASGMTGEPASFLDLGSGGGLPGLVLAATWPDAQVVLLDSSDRRCAALRRAVDSNGWEERVRVVQERAEQAGRDPALRRTQALVVARSFGPPAAVAECGAPFLEVGGRLIVSEPPAGEGTVPDVGAADEPAQAPDAAANPRPERWPAEPLRQLGLEPVGFYGGRFGYQVLRQVEPCPERFPRRNGVPAKRPLF